MFSVVLTGKTRKTIARHFEKSLNQFVHDEFHNKRLKEEFFFEVTWDGYKPYAMVNKSDIHSDLYSIRLNVKTCRKLLESILKAEPFLFPNFRLHGNYQYDYNYIGLNTELYNERQVLLVNLMFVYLINHEVGHTILGHIDYNDEPVLTDDLLQTQEYYADLFGFRASFEFLLLYLNNHLVETVSIYVEMCYRLWEHVCNEHSPTNSQHPNVFIRLRYMIDWLADEVKMAQYDINKDLQNGIIKECEWLYVFLLGETDQNRIMERYYNDEETVKKIESHMKELDILMKPYAYNFY